MKYFASAFCLFALALFSGCGTGKSTLHVHNDGDFSVNVEIDGKHEMFISSGGSAKRFVSNGEHQITVQRKDKVVFDQTKLFEPCPEGTPWRHYLLDPDADTKFGLYEVYYYEDRETAKKSKKSSKIRGMPKGNWIDVPAGATAVKPMGFTITAEKEKTATRRCVMEITKK